MYVTCHFITNRDFRFALQQQIFRERVDAHIDRESRVQMQKQNVDTHTLESRSQREGHATMEIRRNSFEPNCNFHPRFLIDSSPNELAKDVTWLQLSVWLRMRLFQ